MESLDLGRLWLNSLSVQIHPVGVERESDAGLSQWLDFV